MDKKLILFDIDGVLIKEGTFLGRWYFAIKKVFNVDADVKQISTSGKTEIGILSELARISDISESDFKTHINELRDAMIEYVKNHTNETKIHIQDGVKNLLNELKNRGFILGLVTGNFEKIAEIKLKKVNLFHFFDVGGFGEVSDIRNKLIEEAIERANSQFKIKIDKKNVYYFGDSPLDIKAGKETGIIIVAVATGKYLKEDLEKSNPDFILQDLTKLNKVLEVIK